MRPQITIFAVILVGLLFMVTKAKVENDDKYHYGTKAPYEPAGILKDFKSPDGCTPVQINMVIRHGSRFPSSSSKERMETLINKINKAHKSKFSYNNLTFPWMLPVYYKFAEGSELSPRGELEEYSLAKRFLERFPTVFRNTYWNRFYEFVSTAKKRTVRSAAAFSYGLFEVRGNLGVSGYQPIPVRYSGPSDNDTLLRSYDVCPRYKQEIKEGSGLDQWREFNDGPEMKQLIATVQERLQIKEKVNITSQDVYDMLMLCAFSTLNNDRRDWCTLFTEEDLNVLNYLIDLKEFYSHSYGNKLSYQISCPLMADITKSLDKYVTEDSPFGVFRFGHSGTVLSLMSILELYFDNVILYANQYDQNLYRIFKIYKMIPMNANIAFVLNKCSDQNYRVQALFNEKLVSLPCCVRNGQQTCKLDTFKKCFAYNNCNFSGMCKVSGSGVLNGFWPLLVAVMVNILHNYV